jgi:hypothetical protein
MNNISYLSTNLISQNNITLADIEIKNYKQATIDDMESNFVDSVENIKW